MNIITVALGKALDYLESHGMSREEAARELVEYIVFNYLTINRSKEEGK